MPSKSFPNADVRVVDDEPTAKVAVRISGTSYHMPPDEAEVLAHGMLDAVAEIRDEDVVGHPLPWRTGDRDKGERPWMVLDANERIVLDCCDDDGRQTLEMACAKAARVVAAANA